MNLLSYSPSLPITAPQQTSFAQKLMQKTRDSLLLNQLQTHLQTIEDMLGRLQFSLRELQSESMQGSPVQTGTENRRSDLLRRATLSLLASTRRSRHS